MLLTFDDIKNMSFGYENISENEDGIFFERFTEEEYAIYESFSYFSRLKNPAGVKMRFKTDAKAINMDVFVDEGTDRLFFGLDIYSDDILIGSIKNFDDNKMTGKYSEASGKAVHYPHGIFNGCFDIGDGEKEIKIFFPWSLSTYIRRIELVGANYAKALPYDKTMLIYGDSITHGYDSAHPSKAYSVCLAEYLNAKCHIKAIGGEIFRPPLAKAALERHYDYISIAYGTNDFGWAKSREEFQNNASEFISIISRKFPQSQIFVITPIWRNFVPKMPVGTMEDIYGILNEISSQHLNVKCIYGWELVPHDEKLYGDLMLHPSDSGFEYYFNNLKEKIK